MSGDSHCAGQEGAFILPVMRGFVAVLIVFCVASSAAGFGQGTTGKGPATEAGAQAFLDKANAELLKLSTRDSRADWTAKTYITEDTEATTALINGQYTARMLELAAESHRWDKVKLPADLRREMKLLQLNTPAAPKEPNLLEEQTQLAAQLTGMYGKGKYCPQEGKCLGIDAISNIMAHSTDPEELTRLWVGWHAVGAPMRQKYARFIELQNTGAKELGYHDTGELWRAGYDMTPAQFSAEVDRAWSQLEPLYRELHKYVRSQLIAKYGKTTKHANGMIPTQLLRNI